MERRSFLKAALLGSVAGALQMKGIDLKAADKTTAAAENDMVAVMGGEPVPMYRKAIAAMGGMGKYIKKGDKVVVKPNMGWDKKPEFAANTNPELVAAIIGDCFAAGASQVTVFDHCCDEWQACYEHSGIAEAARKAGAKVAFAHDEKYYKPVELPKAVRLKNAKIHESIVDCDAWINVPILKNHGGAKMTVSMKNFMGIVWDRGFFHSNNLQQCIADASTYEKMPVLNIVDAYRIMTQNGPKGKSLDDVQLAQALFISPDIVAVDTAAITFFSQFRKMDLASVGHIAKGEALHIGTSDLSKLKIERIKM